MAKRERDGWRVYADSDDEFGIETTGSEWLRCYTVGGVVLIDHSGEVELTPARALQFAEKVKAIAERAAKKEVR